MDSYDIIGDVHGCARELEQLLSLLGYEPDAAGAYRHPERSLIFVGDLIDRGAGQLRVLEIVKATADAGAAQVVMGNHEFNAIAFNTEWPAASDNYLRKHSSKNQRQHAAFLDQVPDEQRRRYIEWFMTLPLWLDLGDLRVVHACWHEPSIQTVEKVLGSNRFSTLEQIALASDSSDDLYTAVEVLLKGPELEMAPFKLPPYRDKGGDLRSRARLRWWVDGATTLADLAMIEPNFTTEANEPYPDLPNDEVPAEDRAYVYDGAVPVFFGHYWRQGAPAEKKDWSERAACVDFSVAKGGPMTAYRWSGENIIDPTNFVQVSGS